jgi:LmbE family N-acetylglucosaminyl deacetylase
VIVAHPNDEIVAGGCLISKLPNVRIVHVSTGAPQSLEEVRAAGWDSVSSYTEARRRESLAALELANVTEERVMDFGMDQFEAPFRMVHLTKRLLRFLQQTMPQILLTHAYEGGHPDHDATAFAAHVAVRLLQKNGLKPPVIFEMAIYPSNEGAKVPEFLHSPLLESTTLMLDPKARALKEQMFSCFKSQRQVLVRSPLVSEKFRRAPVYNFRLPPHNGQLHYEKLNCEISGKHWREMATEALDELFLSGPLGLSMSSVDQSKDLAH